MNRKNDCYYNAEGDAAKCPVVCISRDKVIQVLNEMKIGKALRPSDASLELIAASRGVEIQMTVESCHSVLDGLKMPSECTFSIVVTTFNLATTI